MPTSVDPRKLRVKRNAIMVATEAITPGPVVLADHWAFDGNTSLATSAPMTAMGTKDSQRWTARGNSMREKSARGVTRRMKLIAAIPMMTAHTVAAVGSVTAHHDRGDRGRHHGGDDHVPAGRERQSHPRQEWECKGDRAR